jgi:hypothetical protein
MSCVEGALAGASWTRGETIGQAEEEFFPVFFKFAQGSVRQQQRELITPEDHYGNWYYCAHISTYVKEGRSALLRGGKKGIFQSAEAERIRKHVLEETNFWK